MEEVSAEISGPVLASFHQKFSESKADFLALLFGSVDVQNYNENTDLATQTEKSKSRLTVQDWAILKIDKVVNLKTGELKEFDRIKETNIFVGFLKFRKNSVDLSPSFLDRKLLTLVRPFLFLLVGEVTTTTLSIKYNMSTFLIGGGDQDFQEPWSSSIPLVVPNLGSDLRIEYMQGRGGASKALKEMVEGTSFEDSSMMDVESNFEPLGARFHAGMDSISAKLAQLESSRSSLELEVFHLHQKINTKLELSRKMEVIRGLQGDLSTALEVAQFELDYEL